MDEWGYKATRTPKHIDKFINNIWFIPQQLWRPRKMIISGLFTNCLHINTMNHESINSVISFIEENNSKFINFNDIKFKENILYQKYNQIIHYSFNLYLNIKRIIK